MNSIDIKISKEAINLTEKMREGEYQNVSPDWRIGGAHNQLDLKKATERAQILINLIQEDKSKRILEVGCGVGMLVVYLVKSGYLAEGVEPDRASYEAAQQLLLDNNLSTDLIKNVLTEQYDNPSRYDLVCSFQVLEHCLQPQSVFDSVEKLLAPGGEIYFVIPNYQSFWEGHYAIFWPPFLNKKWAKLYVSLLGRNPEYIDTLTFTNPSRVRFWLANANLQILDMGENTFLKRMSGDFESFYADTSRIKRVVILIRKLGLAKILAVIMNYFEWYYPIILKAQKTTQTK